ncbi:unnamed protein product [Bursaphelenchus xylophilus]|uniref:(pine wood nematode) hypothetical protein n=1 Tax=Bursaphelenchus xylophilus TaxID=6326 RepID=A0A1I7RUP4_BURXY|nr:unnamed protein product [Bursaphelenchus xylophilus]CAG9114290.1 unnamed protein product [Bursaphelenchus xylophilus]
MIYENSAAFLTQHSLLITTALESICAPIVLYLTLYHSMQMKRYRYLIMNHVVWNLLMNWALCVYKPTMLFPAPCVTFAPAIHNTWFTGISSMFLVFLVANVEMSVVWSVLYRFFMSYPGRVSDFVERRRGSIIVFIVGQLLVCLFVLSPFAIFQRPSEARETAEFLKRLPHLQQYERSTGYLCTMDIEITGIVLLFGVMLLVFFFVAGTVILFILGRRVTNVNKEGFFAGSAHRMHKMLFKAVLVQVIVSNIFQFVPTTLLLLTFYVQWEEGTTIAAVCVTMVQVHGSVDFITMMYFIVPYRRQLLRLVGRQTGKVWSEQTHDRGAGPAWPVAGHLGIAREEDGPTQTNLADKVLAQTKNKAWCGEAIRGSQRYLQRSIQGILPQNDQIHRGQDPLPPEYLSKAVELFEATKCGERYKVDCNGDYDIDFVAGGQDVRIESVNLVEKEDKECFLKIGRSWDEGFYIFWPAVLCQPRNLL